MFLFEVFAAVFMLILSQMSLSLVEIVFFEGNDTT